MEEPQDMENKPMIGMVSGQEALEQLRHFPLPVDTGVLHLPVEDITWPMLIPYGGLKVRLDPSAEEQLTYGMVTGIIAYEETFHLLARVDYAYGGQEETALFRLEWNQHRQMIEAVGELGIIVLSAEKPGNFPTREELAKYLATTTTFVCELDPQELHRLRIQMIRMNAQANLM